MDIFDVDWFISSLAKDVTIVKRVPDKFMRSMEKPPYTMRVPRKSEPEYYLEQVLPILLRRSVRELLSLFRFLETCRSQLYHKELYLIPISYMMLFLYLWHKPDVFKFPGRLWQKGKDCTMLSKRSQDNLEFCRLYNLQNLITDSQMTLMTIYKNWDVELIIML